MGFMYSSIFFVIVYVAFSSLSASADSVHGCGGFVEASAALIKSRKPWDAKLDYSHITVELRTTDGLVKDRTQCAPNGYYFIPVYDKGSFIVQIKGPEGWSWEPDKAPVVVDHNGCNANEDINFRFTGFTLSGRVVGGVGGESCSAKNKGPSNVNVELLSPSGDTISSVLTSEEGLYTFKNAIPGEFRLRASHPNLKVEVRGCTEVELGFGNGIVDDIFFVPGYDIHGFVVAQGNPILGVHIYLHSKDVVEVDCHQGSGNSPGQEKALCHAVSDADGLFTFKSIPCGAYELIPYYKGENTIFDISPPSMSLSVEHCHVSVPHKFQVTGFSVGGRVLDGNGLGIHGVIISVDGNQRSITDEGGYYKLDQVTSNRYTLDAKKEHYKFQSLKDFLVLPNMTSIVDIKAASYDVCGVVQMVSADYKAKVALTHGPEKAKPQMKRIGEKGNFCFEVPPGEYRLSALAPTPESDPELLFLPPYLDVEVRSPVLNVEFSQALVKVHGSVSCKERCGPLVSVALIRVAGEPNQETKTISLTDESSDFSFSNVLPGKYRLEVKHISDAAESGQDDWCWDPSFMDVKIGAEDVDGIVFVQKGYWVNISSSHAVDAYFAQSDGLSADLKIKKGSQNICIESPGVHELRFVNSCVSFAKPTVKIDTSNPAPIYLKGEKYLLKGQIHVELSSLNGVAELPENLIVHVHNVEGSVTDVTSAKLMSGGSDMTNTARYEYSAWANLGEKLSFVPQDSRSSEGKKLLFYPKQHQVSVVHDGCQASIPEFSGRLGLYVEGSVSPPLSGVHVKIIAAGDSINSQLRRGDSAIETTTGSDGLFIGGPLYDDINYTVEASKPGYQLKRVGPHSFSCQKLSDISVHIFSKDAEELFPPVLLSLSGDDGYRNNTVTGVGGVFSFQNLFPGSFYLRPLLKEYAFSPSAQAIELGSGESKKVIFQATRVAYSATGVVTLLSGQPKDGVSVEARSESKGYYEETITDSSGSFRLRGLLPETTYLIKVVKKGNLGGSKIERASPESISIKVGFEDIQGLDFLVFEPPETTILSGRVEGKKLRELHSHLRVEIKLASDPSKIESVFPLPLSDFFQVKNLPRAKHLLQLRSALPPETHKFESELIEVDLEKHTQIHLGPLRYKIEEDYHKQELTPAPVYPLIVGLSVIALFVSMPRIKDLFLASVGSTVGSTLTTKKDPRKSAIRKKTY